MKFEEIENQPDPRLVKFKPAHEQTRECIEREACYNVHQVLIHEFAEIMISIKLIPESSKFNSADSLSMTTLMLKDLGANLERRNGDKTTRVVYRPINIGKLVTNTKAFASFLHTCWRHIFCVLSVNVQYTDIEEIADLSCKFFARMLVAINHYYGNVIHYFLVNTPGGYDSFNKYFDNLNCNLWLFEARAYEYSQNIPTEKGIRDPLLGLDYYERIMLAINGDSAKKTEKKSTFFSKLFGKDKAP